MVFNSGYKAFEELLSALQHYYFSVLDTNTFIVFRHTEEKKQFCISTCRLLSSKHQRHYHHIRLCSPTLPALLKDFCTT